MGFEEFVEMMASQLGIETDEDMTAAMPKIQVAWDQYQQTGVLPWETEPTTPTTPVCTEGDTRTGGDGWPEVCVNGAWVADTGGGIPPVAPAPTPTTGTTPMTGTISRGIADEYDPFTSYLASIGLGQRPALTPAEQYRVGLYDPISTLHGAQQRMAFQFPQQYDPGSGYISDYAQPYLSDPFSMYAQARGMLGTAFGATPEQRATMGMQYAPVYEGGELAGRGGVTELQDLLGMALRPTLGKAGGSWLAGRLPFEQQMWAGQQAAGGGGGFLDYIRDKYNLGQWF